MTHTLGEIRELLAVNGLEPRRAFGQNFVVDPNTVRRIARLSEVGPGDSVVEIGPGLGSLTLALADTGADITAVEVDHDIVPVLREVVAGRGVEVIEADAAELNWAELLQGSDEWTPGGQSPLQRGHTACAGPASRRAGDQVDARDGATRGR